PLDRMPVHPDYGARGKVVSRAPVGTPSKPTCSVAGRNLAEQPVHLVVRAGGEVEIVRVTRPRAVPEADAPEAVDRDRLAVRSLELAFELPLPVRLRLEGGDPAVAEVADEEVAARLAEVVRRHRQPPRRVQMPVLRDARDQGAARRVLVDDAAALAGGLV